MSRLRLFLLGTPQFELDGAMIELDRRKAVALLAYLAVTARPHHRDDLATLFWPELDQSRARAALRRTLSTLNVALTGDWLSADRETIELKRGPTLWLDVEQFQSLLATGETHGHPANEPCTDCLAALTEAAALYRADLLAGFTLPDSPDFDEWHFFAAEKLRRDLAGALELLVTGLAAGTEVQPALDYARRWLQLDPLHEPVHRWLMQLYARSGQRAAALRQYQECERILAEELGVAPSAETTALYERIRTGGESRGAEEQRNRGAGGQRGVTNLIPPAPLLPGAPASLPPFIMSSAAPPADHDIPFVGRATELAQLTRFLESAVSGQGQVVLVTGEAGCGKTALVHEFARQAQVVFEDVVVAVGNCSAHTGSGDPYLPFREILNLLAGEIENRWRRGLLTEVNAARLWTLWPRVAQALVEFGPALIGAFVPIATLQNQAPSLPPEQRLWLNRPEVDEATRVAQSDLFEQFSRVLQAVAQTAPLLLVIDDAQWADLASINLLFHFGRQLQASRILLLVTYRPDEVALGRPAGEPGQRERHPLEAVSNELKRTYGHAEIDLSQTPGRQFVEALLDSQPNQLGPEFRAALFQRTQGHPLFTVELLRTMRERGDIIKNEQGDWLAGPALNWTTLPARVEAVIEERLGRLDEDLRELLSVASVEGEQFTAQVVAQVQAVSERELLRALSQTLVRRHQLVREEGEVQVNGHFLARFAFAHTLFQQYLYHNLSAGERRLLHRQVAAALEALYAPQVEVVTVQLARHYAQAGQVDKAIDYLLRAGDQARSLYAHQEAADFYQQALVFLKQQGAYDRAARTLMKLGLTYHLGFDFEQARQAYAEGFTLWQRAGTGQPVDLPPAPHALRVVGGEPVTLDPTMAGDGISARIIDQLFSGLLEQSPELEVMPNIAHRWEVLQAGRKYIFHLRDNMRWSDGVPVTAFDFEYGWKRALEPALGAPVATALYDIKNASAFHRGELTDPDQVGVKALDAVTLAVELEGPTSYFLQLLTHNATYPLPRHMVTAYGQAWTKPAHLVTNGPFKLESWQSGQSLTLVRNLDYRGAATGNVTRVELRFLAERSDEITLYDADEIDISALWFLTGPEIERVRQRHADDYLAGPMLNTHYIGFNLSQPPFNDRRVRRAFAMAIDKETLAHVVLGGYAFPASGGFVPVGMPGHSPGIGLPYDPDQARRLLAEAGYLGGRQFPTLEWPSIPGTDRVMEYLEAQWAENLGVKLTSWAVPEKLFFDKLRQTPAQLFRIGWKADYPDPDNFLRASTFRQETRWSNDTYDRLVEQARRLTNQAERLNLYRQADQILVEEAVIIPYLYLQRHLLIKPWVSRYPTSPLTASFWKDVVIEPH